MSIILFDSISPDEVYERTSFCSSTSARYGLRVMRGFYSRAHRRSTGGQWTANERALQVHERLSLEPQKGRAKKVRAKEDQFNFPVIILAWFITFLLQIPNALEKAVIACPTHPVPSVPAAVPIEGDFGGDTSRRE